MVIARILHGSSIDRQGMLHTGDVIREVNGREVGSNPHELQELLRECNGSITLKVLPSYRDTPAPPQVRRKETAFDGFLSSSSCGKLIMLLHRKISNIESCIFKSALSGIEIRRSVHQVHHRMCRSVHPGVHKAVPVRDWVRAA